MSKLDDYMEKIVREGGEKDPERIKSLHKLSLVAEKKFGNLWKEMTEVQLGALMEAESDEEIAKLTESMIGSAFITGMVSATIAKEEYEEEHKHD